MDTTTTAEHDRLAFGEFLRQARERRRLTLEQIADETKIAPRLLTSLEQGNVQPMPKGMYRRAMLRAYAESVGLDTKAALTQFERTFEEPPPREVPLPTMPVPPPTEQAPATATTRSRGTRLALAGLATAAALVLVVWAVSGDAEPETPVQNAVTAAREAAGPVSTPASTPPSSVAPLETHQPAPTSGTRDVVAVTPAQEPAPPPPLATEGRLVVLSDPPGARVTVNDIGWGSTPLTIRYLPLGEKRVRLTKSGYVSQERTVRVDGRRSSATVRVTLRERP